MDSEYISVESFWQSYQHVWSSQTPLTEKQPSTQTFRIITPFYNVQNFISLPIFSLQSQINENFKCYLIDDCSDDESVNGAINTIDHDGRFTITKNTEKKYALENIASTIDSIEDIGDEDIILMLDGDDWLSSMNVLSHLEKVYNNEQCLVTYGSYAYFPTGKKGVEPSAYPEQTITNNTFRNDRWRASHLRTFKYKLWKQINHDDLKSADGYYKVAYDQAVMLPLLEMASDRSTYIAEVLYVYNRLNPLNVDKIKIKEQEHAAFEIRNKKPYRKLR